MKKFFSWLALFLKGAVMGIANVIPGVSGGTLAVIMGIYDKFISAISNILKDFIKNLLFLLPIVLGMGASIIISSKVIGNALEAIPLATALFFEGLIIGGIPILYKKIKGHEKKPLNIVIFLIVFALLLVYTFAFGGINNEVVIVEFNFVEYLKLFLVGVVGAATMIIPGISGSMTLMVLGYYNLVVTDAVGNIANFDLLSRNLNILIPFGLGCVIGIVVIAKIVEYLLKKFEIKTYFAIFGFVFASMIIVICQNIPQEFRIWELLLGFVFMAIGFFVSYFVSIGKIKLGSWEPFKKKEIENNK